MSSPITCHVLNTLSGTPASNLPATLTLLKVGKSALTSNSQITYTATTNEDGRVKEWQPTANENAHSVPELLESYKQGERVPFSIRFEVGEWYEKQGIESFWPEVVVKFYVKKGERHYHVPVLVGPWTYTTYRGS